MKVLIKGAGDLATGIGYRLFKAGYQIIMTDIEVPTTVRRTVAFSAAVYEGEAIVEGVTAARADSMEDVNQLLSADKIPVVVDPEARIAEEWQPEVIVDAIIAKKNLGTGKSDAGLVIGVGPGFTAGIDCDCVIETKRGHYLGRVIREGSAIPNTGVPGNIGGFTVERLIRATAEGIFEPLVNIGDIVEKDQVVAYSGGQPVPARMSGMVRGMLQPGVTVSEGMKCGDIDARCEKNQCYTISDKARAIGGGVLEAISRYEKRKTNMAIVILAAGEGHRFGSNKLLHEINGRRLFEHTIDAVSGLQKSIPSIKPVLVTAYEEIAEYAAANGFSVIRNEWQEQGISKSIKLGLEAAAECAATVFTVSDQPGLTADSFKKLIEGYAAGDKDLACLSDESGEPGNPCVFSRKYYKELFELEGDRGGKGILCRHLDETTCILAKMEELHDIDYRTGIKS